jgi:chromosome segregation ATPase
MKNKLILFVHLFLFSLSDLDRVKTENIVIRNTHFIMQPDLKIAGGLELDYQKGLTIKVKYNMDNENKFKRLIKDYSIQLNLINEGVNEDEHFIDFRFIQDCKFSIQNELIVIKVDKLEDKINFINNSKMRNTFDNNFIQISFEISSKLDLDYNKLVSSCKERKQEISKIKDSFYKIIENKFRLYYQNEKLSLDISKKIKKKEDLERVINDTEKFLEDKKSLSIIKENQMNHFRLLKQKSKSLNLKELHDKSALEIKFSEIKNKITLTENIEKIRTKISKKLENKLESLKKDYKKTGNELINLQKNYIEAENVFSVVKNEELSIDFDYKQLLEKKRTIDSKKGEILNEINKIEQKILNTISRLKKVKDERKSFEDINLDKKNQTIEIDRKINQLIEERSKLVENIKANLDIIRLKDDSIENLENEITSLNSLKDFNKLKKEDSEKNLIEYQEKIGFILKSKDEIAKKYNLYLDNLKFADSSVQTYSDKILVFDNRIKEYDKNLKKIQSNIKEIIKEKDDLLSEKTSLEVELKKIEMNLKSNQLLNRNFDQELNKISSAGITHNSPISIEGLNLDNIKAKEQLDNEIFKIKNAIKSIEDKIKINSKEYKTFIENKIKKEFFKVDLLIDVINEESATPIDMNNLTKIKQLIELIKS